MNPDMLLRRLAGLLALAVVLAPLGLARPTAGVARAAESQAAPQADTLPPIEESESNDLVSPTTNEANPIGPATFTPQQSWQQTITGRIATSGDIDYFRLQVAPASTVVISLTNLAADYDLVLASAANELDQGNRGLDEVLDIGGSIGAIGGSIGAIGGSIGAIGGSIGAIGGSIGAIGGSIGAIGGSIGAISANSGTTAERIEALLWQPGLYFIAVGAT